MFVQIQNDTPKNMVFCTTYLKNILQANVENFCSKVILVLLNQLYSKTNFNILLI